MTNVRYNEGNHRAQQKLNRKDPKVTASSTTGRNVGRNGHEIEQCKDYQGNHKNPNKDILLIGAG